MKQRTSPVTPYSSQIRNRLLLLLFGWIFSSFYLTAGAQTNRVSGTVKDAKGATLQQVNVTIKGKKGGTTTNASGEFSIEVSDAKAVLVFSQVGHLSKEETVGDRKLWWVMERRRRGM